MKASRTKRSLAGVSVATSFYVAVGLAVRLTIKDAIPFASAAYYATPLPVITFAAVFAVPFLCRTLFQQDARERDRTPTVLPRVQTF